MPYLIAESEPGGMELLYCPDKHAFLEAIMKHPYRAETDEKDAKDFIEKSQVGDWMPYSKGAFIKVKEEPFVNRPWGYSTWEYYD